MCMEIQQLNLQIQKLDYHPPLKNSEYFQRNRRIDMVEDILEDYITLNFKQIDFK